MAFSHGPFGFDTATTEGSDDFLYDSPNQSGATLPATSQNRRWRWDNNDTPSTNIGPESGAGGDPDGYLYTEASNTGDGFNDVYTMELDFTLDAEANNIVANFKTNQRGNDNDSTCVIETNENGAGWVERGTVFGGSGDPDKVSTSGSQIWSSRVTDLTGLISHASTRLRIKVTFPSSGTSWHNDYGIDDVEVVGTTKLEREQEGFRFRNDDDTEADATWRQLQDVDDTIAKNVNFRLRVLLNMTGNAPSEQYQIEYKETGDAAAEYRPVPLT